MDHKIIDWNKKSLDELALHLENHFRFDSSGIAKAAHELIAFYRKNSVKFVGNFIEGFEIKFIPSSAQQKGSATLLINPEDMPNNKPNAG